MQVQCKRYASTMQNDAKKSKEKKSKAKQSKENKNKQNKNKQNKNKQNKIFPHFSNLTFLGIYISRV